MAESHCNHCREKGQNPYDVIRGVSNTLPAGWELAKLVVTVAAWKEQSIEFNVRDCFQVIARNEDQPRTIELGDPEEAYRKAFGK